jgi:hypothetical protein
LNVYHKTDERWNESQFLKDNTGQEKMLARMDVFEEKLNKMNAAWKLCLGNTETNTETAQERKKPAQQLCHLKEINCLANKNKKL